MPARGTKKEAAPVPPKSLLKKLESAKVKVGEKRNVRERETANCNDSDEVCESEWHNCIQRNEWETVVGLLDVLRGSPNRKSIKGKRNSKSTEKKRRSSISWLWKGSGASRSFESKEPDQVFDQRSLLVKNSSGRTPLIMALNEVAIPDQIILEILAAQPKAVSVPDGKGRMPLHFAVGRQKKIDVLAELVELYPQAMSHEDEKGKTPLAYAMDVVKQQTDLDDAPASFWATQEKFSLGGNWQERQIKLWEVPRWLLLSSASHRETHLSMDNGQPLLIEALLHAAPPTLISLLIAASSTLLRSGEKGTSFCCSAMYLCIFRRYPLFILRQLGAFCPADVRFVRDETGLGLVSAQYVTSCFEKNKLMEYVAAEDFMATLEHCIIEGRLTSDNSLFLEWWTILRYLLFFCAEKDPDSTPEDYLLHAALMNADTPPNVIRLLLALYPDSARQVDPVSAHPLHLYCMHREYIPRNYESPYMHGLNVIDMLLSLDESAVFHRFDDRLPLHLAIATGRNWSTLHPLVSSYRTSLRKPDPITCLYPALLAATYQETPSVEKIRLLQLTRNQYSSIVWRGLSEKQQQNAVARMRHSESLKRLETIFELLRRYPQCIETAIVTEEESYTDSDRAGAGVIATHYLSWCYKKVNGVWEMNHEKMDVLRTNIRMVRERGVLGKRTQEFVEWLRLLKMYIWHCYNAATSPRTEETLVRTIPRDDNFLLHAAVSSSGTPPDVIQLLIGLYPQSAFMTLPNTQTLPLHLACKTPTYIPRYFEDTGRHTSIEFLIRASPEAVLMRSEDGRMPLHVAIDAGKTIGELRELIKQAPITLTMLDPVKSLCPFQMMALGRMPSTETLLRFKDIAKNKQGEAWEQISQREQENLIQNVRHEHELAVMSSVFELLRLNVSALEVSSGPVQPSAESMEIVLDTPLYGENKWASYHDRPKRKQSQLRRLLSGLSGDSLYDDIQSDASAFSSFDMVSTISNVSSHLSFRGRKHVFRSSSGRMVSDRFLNDERCGPESEDSDIYSEEESFFDNEDLRETETGEVTHSEYGHDGDWNSNYVSAGPVTSDEDHVNSLQCRTSPMSDCPETWANEGTSEELDTTTRKKQESAVINSDGASLVEVDKKPTLIDLISGSGGSQDELAPWKATHPGNNDPGLRSQVEQETSSDTVRSRKETLERESAHTVKLSNRDKQHDESLSSFEVFDDSMQITEMLQTASISKSNHDDGNSEDGSIQDDLVKEEESQKPATREEEDVVFFRLRRSSYRTPGGPKLRRKKGTRAPQNDSSVEMDFLSILHASLPEGGMDYLSILEASSGSLPPTYDSLPTGRFDRMRQIEEFPTESENGTNVARDHIEKILEGQLNTTAHSKPGNTDETSSVPRPSGENSSMGQAQERRSKSNRMAASNEGKGAGLIRWQRNPISLMGPIESKPSHLNAGDGSSLIHWKRIKHDREVPLEGTTSSFRRGEDVIHWRRNKHVPKLPLGPSSSRVGKGTFQIEWRRNKHAPTGASRFISHSGATSEQAATNTRAPHSLLLALEARRNSLEVSRIASTYMGVKPQKLKSCLQCGLRERGVLMLPCTHLCLCRECSEEIEKISSCPICMNPVIDTMVVL